MPKPTRRPCSCRRPFGRYPSMHAYMTEVGEGCHCRCHGTDTTNVWAAAQVDMVAGARL